MICRRCLRVMRKNERAVVLRGASVHKDKAVCTKNLKPYRAEVAVDSKPRNRR